MTVCVRVHYRSRDVALGLLSAMNLTTHIDILFIYLFIHSVVHYRERVHFNL